MGAGMLEVGEGWEIHYTIRQIPGVVKKWTTIKSLPAYM